MNTTQMRAWFGKHKRTLITSSVIVVLVGSLMAIWLTMRVESTVSRTSPLTSELTKQTTTVPSPLSGLPVSSALAKRPVTAIMIENSPDARPQSGLDKAGVVFEAIAEGGITRFVAFYQEGKPNPIGPIRSLRPYYIDWVMAFDAGVAHVGGSSQAKKEVKKFGIKDLDQFFNAGAYYRTNDRVAPHNMYSDFKKLDSLNRSKGFNKSNFTPLPRKPESRQRKPSAARIDLDISSPLYNVQYRYNKTSNSYRRFLGGEKHVAREGNKQLSPKVVVALKIPNGIHSDGQHMRYDTVGKGKALIFQDGGVIKGSWRKKSRNSQIELRNAKGKTVALNPGQTWFTAVSPGQTVTYKP